MMTFSDLVDSVSNILARSGENAIIASVCNGAIRRLQSQDYFAQDLKELRIDTTGASHQPFLWRDIPKDLRSIQYAKYSNGVPAIPVVPSRHIESLRGNYYYACAGYVVFSGVPEAGQIDIAYYRLLPRLNYYADQQEAPARYDYDKDEWLYRRWDEDKQKWVFVPTLGTEDLDEAARDKVCNWILRDYDDAAQAIAVRDMLNVAEDVENSARWTAIANEKMADFRKMAAKFGDYN